MSTPCSDKLVLWQHRATPSHIAVYQLSSYAVHSLHCMCAGKLHVAGVISQLDAALIAAVAGIAALLTPAIEPLTRIRRSGTRKGTGSKSTGPRAIAAGSLRVSADRVAVNYLLPVAVPTELRQPGAQQLTEAVLSFSVAEAAADVDVAERTADCSVSGLRFSHAEAGPSGITSMAAGPTQRLPRLAQNLHVAPGTAEIPSPIYLPEQATCHRSLTLRNRRAQACCMSGSRRCSCGAPSGWCGWRGRRPQTAPMAGGWLSTCQC